MNASQLQIPAQAVWPSAPGFDERGAIQVPATDRFDRGFAADSIS